MYLGRNQNSVRLWTLQLQPSLCDSRHQFGPMLPHSEGKGFCSGSSLRAAHLQLLVAFVDIGLTSGLRAAMQRKTFRQPHTIYALYEPTLKATKEIWEKLERQPATTVTTKTRKTQNQFLSICLVGFSIFFLILGFKGNTEPAAKFKPFSLFRSHTRLCLRAQVQQISACCRSQILIQIYDYITDISAIPFLLDKHLHYSRQPLICIFRKTYCRSKWIFQNTVWFQVLFCFPVTGRNTLE